MERLKELREAKKVTQSQLGEYIGAKKSAISLWESGKRQPDQETLVRLASYFGVSVDYLLGREDSPTPTQQNALDDKIAQATRLLEGLNDENFRVAVEYIKYLAEKKK